MILLGSVWWRELLGGLFCTEVRVFLGGVRVLLCLLFFFILLGFGMIPMP
jgi:hypothetical protein